MNVLRWIAAALLTGMATMVAAQGSDYDAAEVSESRALPSCEALRARLVEETRDAFRRARSDLASGRTDAARESFARIAASLEDCETECLPAGPHAPPVVLRHRPVYSLLFEPVAEATAFNGDRTHGVRQDSLTRWYALSLFQLGRLSARRRPEHPAPLDPYRWPAVNFCKAIQARPDVVIPRGEALAGRARRAFQRALDVCSYAFGWRRGRVGRNAEYAPRASCSSVLLNPRAGELWMEEALGVGTP